MEAGLVGERKSKFLRNKFPLFYIFFVSFSIGWNTDFSCFKFGGGGDWLSEFRSDFLNAVQNKLLYWIGLVLILIMKCNFASDFYSLQ